MAEIGVFTGAALASLDKAGRYALPAALRNSVPGEGKGRQLYITTHEAAPCLAGSGTDRLKHIAARIDRAEDIAVQRGEPFDRFAMQRQLFGPGETVPIDSSGRFILPEVLSELAAFGSEIFLFGVGPFFEIWDLPTLLVQTDASFEGARRAAEAALRVRERKAASQ